MSVERIICAKFLVLWKGDIRSMKMKKNIYLYVVAAIVLVYIILLTILYCSEAADSDAVIRTFGDAFWYSLVTLTTVDMAI